MRKVIKKREKLQKRFEALCGVGSNCDYEKKEKAFLDLAKGIGNVKSCNNGTQVFMTEWDENKPTIIVISGTHGIEGYAGSDIQSEILKNEQNNKDRNYNIILVHASNHYGFRECKRFTDDNIDLNRNFYDKMVPNPYYTEKVNEVFLKYKKKDPTTFNLMNFAIELSVHDIFPWQVASKIMRGQYEYEDGFEYGGKKLSKEHRQIVNHLSNKFTKYQKKLAVIDIHTGVGKAARKSNPEESYILIVDDEDQFKLNEEILGKNIIDIENYPISNRLRNSGHGVYKVHGSAMSGYGRTFGEKDKTLLVTQEFATKDETDIFQHLVSDQKNLCPYFYINEPWWTERVKQQGYQLYEEIIQKWLIKSNL